MENNDKKKKSSIVFGMAEIDAKTLDEQGLMKSEQDGPLSYIVKQASGNAKAAVPRIAFTQDPVSTDHYAGIFQTKKKLLPDSVLKLVRVQNQLIASILRSRGNTLSMFGHIQKDRFDIGVDVSVKSEFEAYLKKDQLEKVKSRIEKFKKLLLNCGHTEGVKESEKMNLSEFFYLQTVDGISLGRFATEVVYEDNESGDKSVRSDSARTFNRFRPVDAGTIYRTVKKGEGAKGLRLSGIRALESQTGDKINIDPKALENDEYAYVQVVEGTPKQAFAHDEMIVCNLYPSNDIDHNGYPITPVDTSISAVTTHISIDAYNRLYFQNGRAAKGILVVKSEDMDQDTLNILKQEFIASINNVGNSFRVPVFGIEPTDEISWQPMVSSAGDGEFQFLYDQVARNILSAFSISPEEINQPHLAGATNSQSLSESSNQYSLTVSREAGLKPLILRFQSFLNEQIFPIVDPELAQLCVIRLVGLDAQTKEQESLRMQQDMPIHMTYDDVMSAVDKDPIGVRMGGKLVFNERYQIATDKFLNVAELMDFYLEDPTALIDPLLQYKRDPFYFNHLNILLQVNPAAIQAKFAYKEHTMDILKMLAQDQLDEDEE